MSHRSDDGDSKPSGAEKRTRPLTFTGEIAIPTLPGCGYYSARQKGLCHPMNGFDSPTALGLLVAVQCFGVLSAAAARLSEGSACQAITQWVFLVALPLVGAATVVALMVGPGIWVACATSLAVMVLTATCDLRISRSTSGF
jgi:hypothetical protein